jgi:subtilase family serine protease
MDLLRRLPGRRRVTFGGFLCVGGARPLKNQHTPYEPCTLPVALALRIQKEILMHRILSLLAVIAILLGGLAAGSANVPTLSSTLPNQNPAFEPVVSDWEFISGSTTPPTAAQCASVGRRCFVPAAMANSYNYASLLSGGHAGQGVTIAVVDSFGSDTIRHDLHVFDQAFGLQAMCGEEGVTCAAGMPTFSTLDLQGAPPTNAQPPSNGTGQEDHALWDLEVSLDVEWAHSTAPMANILLVTTPTAETLGVQGIPQMMNAIQYVVDHHLADVISMSFGTGEGAFNNGTQALLNNRQGFMDAQAQRVTLFASSGDGGTTNTMKEPVKNPAVIPYPSVIWPASDPLVTAVGGTYLCTDATTGTSVDTVDPPVRCQPARNPAGDRETGWVAAGGGYSILFPRPSYQNTLPPGSTYVGSSAGAPGPNSNMRGIPDVAYQASATTGVLVYISLPPDGSGGLLCGSTPCSTGWYDVGGTSASSPQWAGLIAIADQMAGHDLGFINPALYQIANNPAQYANDFYDVDTNCNQQSSIPGYCASTGWDAVTGLGTPNAANLIPDLIAALP